MTWSINWDGSKGWTFGDNVRSLIGGTVPTQSPTPTPTSTPTPTPTGHADSHADASRRRRRAAPGWRTRPTRSATSSPTRACSTRAGSRTRRCRGGSRRTSWRSGCRSDRSASRRTPSLRQDPRGLGVDGVPGRGVVACADPSRPRHAGQPGLPRAGQERGRARLPRRRTSRTRSCPPTARGGPPPTREAARGPMRAEDRGCAGRGRRRRASPMDSVHPSAVERHRRQQLAAVGTARTPAASGAVQRPSDGEPGRTAGAPRSSTRPPRSRRGAASGRSEAARCARRGPRPPARPVETHVSTTPRGSWCVPTCSSSPAVHESSTGPTGVLTISAVVTGAWSRARWRQWSRISPTPPPRPQYGRRTGSAGGAGR